MSGWEFTETKAAWKRLKRAVRALLSEWLIAKGIDIAPDDYTPVILDMLTDAERRARASVEAVS